MGIMKSSLRIILTLTITFIVSFQILGTHPNHAGLQFNLDFAIMSTECFWFCYVKYSKKTIISSNERMMKIFHCRILPLSPVTLGIYPKTQLTIIYSSMWQEMSWGQYLVFNMMNVLYLQPLIEYFQLKFFIVCR